LVEYAPQRSLIIASLALLVIGATPDIARGEEGEVSVSAGGTVARWASADTSTVEGGLALGATWWLTDFWSAGLRLRGVGTLSGPDAPAPAASAHLEARYVLDALTWVPWVCAGAGGSWGGSSGPGGGTAGLVHAGLGLDYRPRRVWSVGIAGRYHLALTDLDQTTGPLELSLILRIYPGDP